MGLH
ncbi:unnamed protein product, partial [Allacma fusca]